jgi:hypothetical protein
VDRQKRAGSIMLSAAELCPRDSLGSRPAQNGTTKTGVTKDGRTGENLMIVADAAEPALDPAKKGGAEASPRQLLRQITEMLEGLRFGSIEIVVHDSRVVQITRIEKVRVGVAARVHAKPQ